MKKMMKVSVMALVAMFALSTVADAQSISIDLKKAGKLFGKKKKSEAEQAAPAIPTSTEGASSKAADLGGPAIGGATAAAAAPAASASAGDIGMKTYKCEGFSMEYPDAFKISEEECDNSTFQANIVPFVTDLYVSYGHFNYTTAEIKAFFQKWKDMYEGGSENWKFETPFIDAKLSTMRGTGNCEIEGVDGKVKIVRYYFVVNKGETSFRGWINYEQANEAKMKPAFDKMIASLKAID